VAADGRALARAVRVAGKIEPVFVEQIADLAAAIVAKATSGDVVITMGAGSIGTVPGKNSQGQLSKEAWTWRTSDRSKQADCAAN